MIAPNNNLRVSDPDDVRYVSANYRRLEALCTAWGLTVSEVRDRISSRRLPQSSYVMASGDEFYPDDYFVFPSQCRGHDIEAQFKNRLASAAEHGGLTYEADDLSQGWCDYLNGIYAVCLRIVLPETIARKQILIGFIQDAIAQPRPEDTSWRADLRTTVDALDALERPFANFDRLRIGGPVTRDVYIRDVRKRFSLDS